jgi:hypothetical protein
MPKDHTPAHDAEEGASHKAGAFDIRMFIGALIGLYGIVLVITGLVSSDGRSINLWTGVCMLLGAGFFLLWARMRPVVVPEKPTEGEASPPTH